MTATTLVSGGRACAREAVIHSLLDPSLRTAVILEGLADGHQLLDPATLPFLQLNRIAPSCMCCTGNLVMRVTLNRLLRSKPDRLFISVASDEHIATLRTILASTPYDQLLTLTENIALSA